MTLFEYVAIAFSLVFSFAALRLVSGLPYALDPEKRYPLHVGHILLQLLLSAGAFWTFWSYRDVEWNFFFFLTALAGPATLYYFACTLVPDSPSLIDSWRDHFYQVRKRYYFAWCFWFLVFSFNTTFLAGLPLVHPIRGLHVVILGTGIAGALSDSPRVQAGVFVVAVLVMALGIALLYLPGALAA